MLGAVLGASLIGLNIGLTRINREIPSTQSPTLSSNSVPSPSVDPTPIQMTVEDFMSRYFEALNQHDFDTAYSFLSPAWGVSRQDYQRYWKQFKAGSIKSEILSVSQRPDKSIDVKLNWSGESAGNLVKVKFRCSVRTTPASYRIEICK
ncbi:hypothetical protein NIES2104_67220 [Leptolyngbya sp. NIES-2104]|nr:hypothetical protein NIES2104_67220 [Leptolyngbya sp. NIES-2104]